MKQELEDEDIKQLLIRLQRDLRACHSTPEAEHYSRMYLLEKFYFTRPANSKTATHWKTFYGFESIRLMYRD